MAQQLQYFEFLYNIIHTRQSLDKISELLVFHSQNYHNKTATKLCTWYQNLCKSAFISSILCHIISQLLVNHYIYYAHVYSFKIYFFQVFGTLYRLGTSPQTCQRGFAHCWTVVGSIVTKNVYFYFIWSLVESCFIGNHI